MKHMTSRHSQSSGELNQLKATPSETLIRTSGKSRHGSTSRCTQPILPCGQISILNYIFHWPASTVQQHCKCVGSKWSITTGPVAVLCINVKLMQYCSDSAVTGFIHYLAGQVSQETRLGPSFPRRGLNIRTFLSNLRFFFVRRSNSSPSDANEERRPLCSSRPLTLLRGGSITFISHLMTALIYSICYCLVSCTPHPSHGQTPCNSLVTAPWTTWILNSRNTVLRRHSHARLNCTAR